jgi:hypothetical protein
VLEEMAAVGSTFCMRQDARSNESRNCVPAMPACQAIANMRLISVCICSEFMPDRTDWEETGGRGGGPNVTLHTSACRFPQSFICTPNT